MQISSRLTIAVHLLTLVALDKSDVPMTSDKIAGSVGVNPVIIRKTLSQLKKAGLIDVSRGRGGITILKTLCDIKLYDVYLAVESLGESQKLFSFHDNPNPNCPIGRNIHGALDDKLKMAQEALENSLRSVTLTDIVEDAKAGMKQETLSKVSQVS